MNAQRGLPQADSARWDAELNRLYQQRDLVAVLIDCLERYSALVERSGEWRTGDSGVVKKPCLPSYGELTGALIPGRGAASPVTAALRNRRAG